MAFDGMPQATVSTWIRADGMAMVRGVPPPFTDSADASRAIATGEGGDGIS